MFRLDGRIRAPILPPFLGLLGRQTEQSQPLVNDSSGALKDYTTPRRYPCPWDGKSAFVLINYTLICLKYSMTSAA